MEISFQQSMVHPGKPAGEQMPGKNYIYNCSNYYRNEHDFFINTK